MNTLKTNVQEYFYSIPGLSVPTREVSDSFIKGMEYIVDWVPQNADSLQFLFEYHTKAFIIEMEMLREMLGCIHAKWLKNDASMILKVAQRIDKAELCVRLLTTFIVKLHTLAIDIQMAQKNNVTTNDVTTDNVAADNVAADNVPTENSNDNYNEIERYKSVINSMMIISGIIENSDDNTNYEKILDILESTQALKENDLSLSLISSISSRDIEGIKKAVDKISAEYLRKINVINLSLTKTTNIKKILIVDDMAEMLNTLTLMLQEYYQVFALSDGYDALELIDSWQQPDAFILDIDMPIMDGFTLAQNIRERQKYRNTPILFLTSNSTRDIVVKACWYKASTFIVKPANKDIIISRLSSCFN